MGQTVAYFVFVAVLIFGFCVVPREKRTRAVCVTVVLIALLLELFVANYHSYHLSFGDYEEEAVDLSGAKVLGTVEGGMTSYDTGRPITVTLQNVGKPVGTVKVECELPAATEGDDGTSYVDVSVDIKDESHSASYRYYVADGRIVRGDHRSSVIVLDLTGEVSEMCIRLSAPEGEQFTLRSVTLNSPVPFRFSILRSALLIFGVLALYALATFPSLRAKYGEKKRLFLTLSFSMTALLILAALGLTLLYQYDRGQGFWSSFLNEGGNQITRELVDAFKAGQVHLTDAPPKELLDLENPYDWSQRIEAGISYKWDHLLFEGRYYSYYGIAPVILLFLPYHLLTGLYFPTPEAVLLFGALGIVFLTLLFLEFCNLFCKKIPVNILLCSLIVLQMSSGVWYNFCSPLFYEIAQASGFLFTCAGFFFLLRSRVIGEGKIRWVSLMLSGFCLGTAVLCRPTLALYCVTALPFLVYGFFKLQKQLQEREGVTKGKRIWAYVGYAAASLGCFALLGGAQMLYNYARFGSPLEFGIQYSLTINDFTRAQYHTDFVLIGLYNYLLAFPKIMAEFPYVFSNLSTLSVNGYYFIATDSAGGLLWRALPTFGYLGAGRAWKSLEGRERRQVLWLLLPVCILAPMIILFSIWESGYCVRYGTDFAWQMILGGMAVLYLLYCRQAERQTRTIVERFFLLSAVLAVVINGALIYGFMSRDGYLQSTFLSVERLFDFWK